MFSKQNLYHWILDRSSVVFCAHTTMYYCVHGFHYHDNLWRQPTQYKSGKKNRKNRENLRIAQQGGRGIVLPSWRVSYYQKDKIAENHGRNQTMVSKGEETMREHHGNIWIEKLAGVINKKRKPIRQKHYFQKRNLTKITWEKLNKPRGPKGRKTWGKAGKMGSSCGKVREHSLFIKLKKKDIFW